MRKLDFSVNFIFSMLLKDGVNPLILFSYQKFVG